MVSNQSNVPPEKPKPLFIRIEDHLKQRLMAQAKRLNISQSAAMKMALVKFLEEEELIEDKNKIQPPRN
jgi:predicted transcriptional regulator